MFPAACCECSPIATTLHTPQLAAGRLIPEGLLSRLVTSLVQNLPGAPGVVVVDLAGRVGPGLLGEDRVGDARLAEQKLLDDGRAVDGVGDGLPHARVFERRVLRV